MDSPAITNNAPPCFEFPGHHTQRRLLQNANSDFKQRRKCRKINAGFNAMEMPSPSK
jgi:hypothetical protein